MWGLISVSFHNTKQSLRLSDLMYHTKQKTEVIFMQKKIYRTAIYCRLSREDGDKVESNSIASQRAICEDFIAKHDDLELACEPFIDDGYSGVSFNRPQFKELEDALRKGKIDCIVVKDLSRFSRNYIDGGRYLEKIFPQLGIRFIAVNDAYDSLTGDPQSDSFIIPFKNLINDSYCKDISMKIRSSLEVKQKNGEFVGAFAPYGYRKSPEDKNRLIVDEDVSEYVQMIFSMYKDGFSIGRIADRLNQMGVLSPMEYKHSAGVKFETVFKTSETAKWTYKAVHRILTNEVYIGVLAQGKRGTPNYKVRVVQFRNEEDWVKVENAHEPLVSYEDFMAVKEMMKRDMRCSPDKDEAHLFSGFLFCADCHQSMIRKTVPSKNKKYVYFVCSSNKHSHTCSPHSISEKEVEEKVFRAIHDQVELVVNLEKALAMIDRLPSKSRKAFNYEAQIAKIEEEIERYQKLKLRLYEDLSDGIIDKSEYFDFRNSYTKIIEEKQETLLRVKKEMKQVVATGTTERNWVTLFKQYENIDELNRRILMALVDRVLVYEDHAIEIIFKYRDEYQQTLEYVLGYADELAIAV
jgi:site-specific recombinases, DNA invertase pin homologs